MRRIFLYGRTIRHLKLKQIYYQLYNRFKLKPALKSYLPKKADFSFLNFSYNVPVTAVTETSSFTFLNLNKDFETIDWAFEGYGKLWNYNLQYLNYLHQTDISLTRKLQWLHEIGEWLINNRLKPEPYPISLRGINIIRFLSENKIADNQIEQQTYAQLSYLYENIEYHILGNHLLENAFSLLMGGHAFNNINWQQKGKDILYKELEEQILDDGAHFELSPMYHQLMLFRVLELIDWYQKANNIDVGFLQFVKNKAGLMLGWLTQVTFANGNIPHVNDATDGIAPSTDQLLQFAQLLNIKPTIYSLKGSGYRKFENENYECIVDVGQIGPSYQPGHSHADTFSFIVNYNNGEFLIEAGTSTYQLGAKRTFERSTAAHNTVVIQNKDQSEVWSGFRVGKRANVNILKDTHAIVSAEHDGYKDAFKVTHNREFEFTGANIIIKDKINSSRHLSGKAYFHFNEDVKVGKTGEFTYSLNDANAHFIGPKHVAVEAFEYATGYNSYKQGKVIIAEFEHELQSVISFAVN